MKTTPYILILLSTISYSQNPKVRFEQLSKQENTTINELFLNNDTAAKQFVAAMDDENGNAVIKNKTFRNGTFVIQKANHKITLDKVDFSGANVSFSSKKEIDILPGTTLMPDDSGEVTIFIAGFDKQLDKQENTLNKEAIFGENLLYPNPNKGVFTINLGFENQDEISVVIYDTQGKSVYKSSIKGSNFEINLPNLPSGLYLVKLQGKNYEETLKFIKE